VIYINWIAIKVIRSYGLIVWVPPEASIGHNWLETAVHSERKDQSALIITTAFLTDVALQQTCSLEDFTASAFLGYDAWALVGHFWTFGRVVFPTSSKM
jgi:phage terminase large subunit